jgi:hypothetical protein
MQGDPNTQAKDKGQDQDPGERASATSPAPDMKESPNSQSSQATASKARNPNGTWADKRKNKCRHSAGD